MSRSDAEREATIFPGWGGRSVSGDCSCEGKLAWPRLSRSRSRSAGRRKADNILMILSLKSYSMQKAGRARA